MNRIFHKGWTEAVTAVLTVQRVNALLLFIKFFLLERFQKFLLFKIQCPLASNFEIQRE